MDIVSSCQKLNCRKTLGIPEFLVEKQMILIKKIYLRLIVYKTQGCQGPYALLRPLPPSCNYNPLCWLYG